jgi:anaerobic ribonucleoside-triphosphate reductase activating protein
MSETTWIIDAQSGELTVEGLQQSELVGLAADLLQAGKQVNCARPINIEPLKGSSTRIAEEKPTIRVFRIYHNSVVEGPGRRSVLQMVGCPIRCEACFVPETHDLNNGVKMPIGEIVELLLDREGEPRDGITILGGEPFLQPDGLLALVQDLKRRGLHITIYSGYTLEQLAARPEQSVKHILELTDILIDGPFIKALSEGAGEWRGSTNQRIIHSPSRYSSSNCTG